ncbi:MAG: S8 family serine peptidase, partial [Propionibacteriaceae bacterium]|nr:S8 family serine peptidase [Propionibacteriaceae bacterium]
MRVSLRHPVTAICAFALTVGTGWLAAPVASADPGGGQTPPVTTPSAQTGGAPTGAVDVRLITGDVVHLQDGTVASVTPGPRSNGQHAVFSINVADDQTYVIPSDVTGLLGDSLDKELFNVTKLASYKLDPDEGVPAVVTGMPMTRTRAATPGWQVTETLGALQAQVGVADANTDDGPAPAWGLINQVAASSSTTSKVWLDQQYQFTKTSVVQLTMAPTVPPWMSLIGADVAHDDGFTGTGVTVGVVDSGIDMSHPDFAGQTIHAQDFTGSGSAYDAIGHGTAVASEIIGTGAASAGTYVGVAPGATLVDARVIDSNGGATDSAIMAGLEWVAQQGASVINMSLGDSSNIDAGSSLLSQFVNQVSDQYGCLIVVAAGNWGTQTIIAPASANKALTVGATLQDGTLAWFSSTGPRRGDGAVKPEIMAPGAGTVTRDGQGNVTDSTGIVVAAAGTGTYTSADRGTSMAAPLVTGAAALLKQANPTISSEAIRATLMASAKPLPDSSSVFEQGAGLLDIPAALHQTITTSPTQLNFGEMTEPYAPTSTQTLTYVNQGTTDETMTLTGSLVFTTSLGQPTDTYLPVAPPTGPRVPAQPSSDSIFFSHSTITIPAGGTASVDVTVHPAASSAGYIGGYVTATGGGTTLRTPVGWQNQSGTFNLTITATDDNGTIAYPSGDIIGVMNLNTGESFDVVPTGVTTTVAVTPGDYAIFAYLQAPDSRGNWYAVYGLAPITPVYDDTSVTLDGTKAQPINLVTDRPVDDTDIMNNIMASSPEYRYYRWIMAMATPSSLATATQLVTPVSGGLWQIKSTAEAFAPVVEASLDDCGQTKVPMSNLTPITAGQYAWHLVSVSSLPLPAASAPGEAALAHFDNGYGTGGGAPEFALAAQEAGYAALIIDSAPVFASFVQGWMRFPLLTTSGLTIPVLLTDTNTGDQLRALPTTLHILSHGESDYLYALTGVIPLDQPGPYTMDGTASSTAAVTVQHRSMRQDESWYDSFASTFGAVGIPPNFNPTGARPVPTKSSYLAYVSADLPWTISSSISVLDRAQGLFLQPSTTSHAPRTYAAGGTDTVTFGSQVNSIAQSARSSITQNGTHLTGAVPGLVDGQGQSEYARNGSVPNFASVTFELTDRTTGQQVPVSISADAVFDAYGLDTSHTYRLDETTAIGPAYWSYSTNMDASWTWQASSSNGPVPLYQVWYELPGLDANNAGSTTQPIVLHIWQPDGSTPQPIQQVTLKTSTDDGATWTDVPVTLPTTTPPGSIGAASGETLYAGTIHSAVGDMVSLKSAVTGATTSFDGTVTDAFAVTATPQGFAQVLTWSCQAEMPPAPTITSANANAISGTTDPATTVEVTYQLANGTTKTVTATPNSQGDWTVDTPADAVRGPISAVAISTIGVRSTETTGNLDIPAVVPVTSVTVTPATVSLTTGDTTTLNLAVAPSDATNPDVTWSSSDTNVATVTQAGVVTAVAPGTTTITATAQDGSGKTGTSTVTVTAPVVPVTSVTVTPATVSLTTGDTTTLNLAVAPSDATNPDVTWSSSDMTVATVTQAGVVTAVAPGTTTITATAQDGSGKTGTSTVTVTAPVVPVASAANSTVAVTSTISPTGGTAHLANGTDAYTFTITVRDTAGQLMTGQAGILHIDAPSALTVSAITDNNDGTYTFTATSITPGNYQITATLNGTQ